MRAIFKHAIICSAFSLVFASWSVHAASPGVEALQHFFKDIKTFQAKFIQVVLDENLKVLDEGHGMMWVQRPGLFRWNYAPPQEQEIVGDGERVWLHDVALEQVMVRDQAPALGRVPAILLAGSGDLAQTYKINDLGSQGRFDWVSMIPLDEESSFTEVRVGFESGRLRLIELLDALAQRTRISFFELNENVPIAEHLFEFVAPPGVDIIEQADLL